MRVFLALACLLCVPSAAMAQSRACVSCCPGGVCLRKPFLSVRAPAESSIHVSRGWFRLRVYVNARGSK